MTDIPMTPAGPAAADVPDYPMPRAAGCPLDPTLRLAASLDQIPFKHDAVVYGVYELPVTW